MAQQKISSRVENVIVRLKERDPPRKTKYHYGSIVKSTVREMGGIFSRSKVLIKLRLFRLRSQKAGVNKMTYFIMKKIRSNHMFTSCSPASICGPACLLKKELAIFNMWWVKINTIEAKAKASFKKQ